MYKRLLIVLPFILIVALMPSPTQEVSEVTPTATVVEPTETPKPTATMVATATEEPAKRGSLPVPANTKVNTSGCASDGECHWYNFYWAPTHEIVTQGQQPEIRVMHERCHAHQHWVINGGEPTENNLSTWYSTAEAISYKAIAGGWPYSYEFTTKHNLLEDFAEACALYYLDEGLLQSISDSRYEWMRENLVKEK